MPMDDGPSNIRWERIKRMLKELEYEVVRGMMEGEIDEQIGYRFIVPVSKNIRDGVVACEFRTRPVPRYHMAPDDLQPRLRAVK